MQVVLSADSVLTKYIDQIRRVLHRLCGYLIVSVKLVIMIMVDVSLICNWRHVILRSTISHTDLVGFKTSSRLVNEIVLDAVDNHGVILVTLILPASLILVIFARQVHDLWIELSRVAVMLLLLIKHEIVLVVSPNLSIKLQQKVTQVKYSKLTSTCVANALII